MTLPKVPLENKGWGGEKGRLRMGGEDRKNGKTQKKTVTKNATFHRKKTSKDIKRAGTS